MTGILDFTHALGGSPELDMSKLLAWHIKDSPSLQKGFLDGYTEVGELEAKFWERLVIYQVLVSLGALLVAHQQGQLEQERIHRKQVNRFLDELYQQKSQQL